MILQSLCRYFQILSQDPDIEIALPGYATTGVSFALNLAPGGELLDVLPQFIQVQRGKRLADAPRPMRLPQRVKRSANIAPNFLWDNSAYLLGISDKDSTKPHYSKARFEASRDLHIQLLEDVATPLARAILSYFQNHDCSAAAEHPAIARQLEALLAGGNLVFMLEGCFAQDDQKILEAWEGHLSGQDAQIMQCLITGQLSPIERLHPSLKGVRGASSTGASLVSFNERAYESYNRSQGSISPVGKIAVSQYTTALNFLLSDANPNRKFYLGDTTIVYWAESENRGYETAIASLFDPDYSANPAAASHEERRLVEQILQNLAWSVARGAPIDSDALFDRLGDENPRFYILGLAPNAGRVSVRFFISDPFQSIVRNLMTHYQDLQIVKEFADQPDFLSIYRLLGETVSKKSRDKDASPLLAGAMLRAILTHSPYPAALFNAIITRVRADMDDPQMAIRKINYPRAAVVKAYLLRKYRRHPQNPFQEVLTMALNEESSNPAYLLGRLFAVLEKVQREAIGEVNAGIKDRYFTSACASPASVFPILLRLSQHHISRAEYGKHSERRIQEILNLLDVDSNPIPSRLTLDEQGVFILGYYHQRAAFFAGKAPSETAVPDQQTA